MCEKFFFNFMCIYNEKHSLMGKQWNKKIIMFGLVRVCGRGPLRIKYYSAVYFLNVPHVVS